MRQTAYRPATRPNSATNIGNAERVGKDGPCDSILAQRYRKAVARSLPLSLAEAWAALDQARGGSLPRPVTAKGLARLQEAIQKRHGETLPPEIAASLQIHNGGPSIESYKLLSAAEIPRWTERIPFPDHVAFAADGGGNLLAVNGRGSLVGVERGDGRYLSKFKKAPSIAGWLASVAAKLKRGKLVVLDGAIDEPVVQPSVAYQTPTTQRLEHPFADEVRSAIAGGHLAALTAWLDEGRINPDARDWTETTLLAQAADENQLGVVQLLLARGCPVDIGSESGARTALFCSCWGGSAKKELFHFLLQQGADPNAQTGFDGTPLHSAAMWGHLDLAQALLAAGADPQRTDAKGKTAAYWAAKLPPSQRQEMLALLDRTHCSIQQIRPHP